MKEFFNLVYGGSEGFVSLITRSEGSEAPDSERWFEFPRDLDFMAKYASLRSQEDLYCSVALFSDSIRTKEDKNAICRVVYADADTCAPENFRLPPSITVQTSTGHWHCWWVLDEEVSASAASEASHRISKAHAAQGCDNGWIQSKILRVPGTSNNKREVPEPVTAAYSGEVYTLDTINAVYADIELAPVVQLNNKIPKPVSRDRLAELEIQLDDAGLSGLYLDRPEEGQSWSERLFRLELELFRLGMTPQEVYSVARESSCNKYNPDFLDGHTQTGVPLARRQDPDGTLWNDVQKAQAEFISTEDIEVEYNLNEKTPRAEFLSIDERKFNNENSTFVDTYVAWVKERTDSAETYQRSLAWMLLSSLFGGRGYLPLPWGKTELNLWMLILGDTTRTRKTTAKSFYLRAIHAYEEQTGMSIDIGSDTTKEALTKELGKRDGLVSVLHRDEVVGMFREFFTKSYMTGVIETFTELYDGRVPVVLRATKDSGNKVRASTSFNFVGVGIRKQTAEVLTKSHFESGFLARMLWSVADPPKRKQGSENVRFVDEEEEKVFKYDAVLDGMIADLIRRLRRWNPEQPSAIRMDEAAIKRYDRWAEETMQFIEKYGDDDILLPSFNRMKDSVLKASALLAMYDQTATITLKHLLPALGQSELWFNDMVRMASEVSSSEFERRCDDVEIFINSGENSQRIESSVRKKFARLKPQEMDEVLKALTQQGRIRKSPKDRNRIEAL